jgi:hypothetical protein
MKVLIHKETNKVLDVQEKTFPVHADLEWIDENLSQELIGYTFDRKTKVATPPMMSQPNSYDRRLKELEQEMKTRTFEREKGV